MSDNKLIKTTGILYRIKKIFSKILSKNKYVEYKNVFVENVEDKTKFKDSIIIKEDEEKKRLLNLQELYRSKKIKENEISNEDIEKLNELYDEQICNLQEKIKQNISATKKYKEQIILIKNKLA